jgi:hypothetical protein
MQRTFRYSAGKPADRPKPHSASHVVAPSSGYNPSGPLTCFPLRGRIARQQLPWSFSPLRRISLNESTSPRFASPGTFRSQGFSPSQRLAPRPDVQPYFRLVTPLGFRSTGAFPHCQVLQTHRLQDCPHGVFSSVPSLGLTLSRRLQNVPDASQAFFRASRALLQQRIRIVSNAYLGRHPTTVPLLSFGPL